MTDDDAEPVAACGRTCDANSKKDDVVFLQTRVCGFFMDTPSESAYIDILQCDLFMEWRRAVISCASAPCSMRKDVASAQCPGRVKSESWRIHIGSISGGMTYENCVSGVISSV